MGAVVTVYTT